MERRDQGVRLGRHKPVRCRDEMRVHELECHGMPSIVCEVSA